jgi:uncharacterized lipoprotein
MKRSLSSILMVVAALTFSSCSSAPTVKSQKFAQLRDERKYEYAFPQVWRGIEDALRRHKILSRDPEDVSGTELKKLTQRTLKTDWIYSQSRDKYTEYLVNGTPRKIFLQTRFKYAVIAKSEIGGVSVRIKTEEEVEKIQFDGSSAGYVSVDPDPSRANELLDKILIAIHSAPVI